MFNPVTNACVPSPHPPTVNELAKVTAMLRRLEVQPAMLEPKKGTWAYCKTLPGPDNLPMSNVSHLWDDFHTPQEPANEDGDEDPLNKEEQAQISCLVSGTPLP